VSCGGPHLPAPSSGFLQCVLVAACLLFAGACVAFAGMFAATRCDARTVDNKGDTYRQGRGP
jgi:hypothetical protein